MVLCYLCFKYHLYCDRKKKSNQTIVSHVSIPSALEAEAGKAWPQRYEAASQIS